MFSVTHAVRAAKRLTHDCSPRSQPRVPGLFAAVTGLTVGGKKKVSDLVAQLTNCGMAKRVAAYSSTQLIRNAGPSPQVSLSAAEAYGEADPEAKIPVPRAMAPDVKQGDRVRRRSRPLPAPAPALRLSLTPLAARPGPAERRQARGHLFRRREADHRRRKPPAGATAAPPERRRLPRLSMNSA